MNNADNHNLIGRASTNGGKIHKSWNIHSASGARPDCNQRLVIRSRAKVDQLTPANCCGQCFDVTEERETVQEQAARFVAHSHVNA